MMRLYFCVKKETYMYYLLLHYYILHHSQSLRWEELISSLFHVHTNQPGIKYELLQHLVASMSKTCC